VSLLGIDVGTTGCKAAAFSLDGRVLASAYREYATRHPREGWSELDSRAVLARVEETIAEVAAACRADPVAALCVSSMGEAMTPVSADRQILGPSILMTDARGSDLLAPLVERFGRPALYAINPNIAGPLYSLPKLLWIRRHQAELYAQAHKFLLWSDLVAFMLGAEPMTSFSLANRTLLFDIRRQDWSEALLAASGIAREKLAPCAPSGAVAGTVSGAAAARLGLPRGVAIVVGGHDQCCNSLGAGIARAGLAVCGIGTFECITPTYDHIPDSATMLAAGLGVEHHVLAGLYVSFIHNQSGSLVRWFRDTFAAADKRLLGAGEDLYDALACEMPAEPTRLLVLPHFEPSGAPEMVSDSAGAIVGLKMDTTRGEILKAVMESATFWFAGALDRLKRMKIDTSEFIATGGGARSDPWLQIKADVFGVPLVRPAITETSTLGAAILAGVATGALAGAADGISRFVRRQRVFEPDPRRHAVYRERILAFQKLYPALTGVFSALFEPAAEAAGDSA
jgi:xylulokinase